MDADFDSVLVSSALAYGKVHRYPAHIGVSSTELLLGLQSVAQSVYQQYTNHSLSFWTGTAAVQPITRSLKAQDLTNNIGKMATVLAQNMPRHYSGQGPIRLLVKNNGSSTDAATFNHVQVGFPDTATSGSDFNWQFTASTDASKRYFLYTDFAGNRRVSEPLVMTGGNDTKLVWLMNLSVNPYVTTENMYMLLTPTNSAQHSPAFNMRMPRDAYDTLSLPYATAAKVDQLTVIQEVTTAMTNSDNALITAAQAAGNAAPTAMELAAGRMTAILAHDQFMRSNYVLKGPLVAQLAHDETRRTEPDAMDGNVQLINKRSGAYLVMSDSSRPYAHFAIVDGTPVALNETGTDASNSGAVAPDNSVWTMTHQTGTSYYEFMNTQWAKALGWRWTHANYWKDKSGTFGSTSDYGLSTDIINANIHIETCRQYDKSAGVYDYFLYVIEPSTQKRQYIVPYHDVNISGTWSYIFLVSEDSFDPAVDLTTSQPPSFQPPSITLTAEQRYQQFMWTIVPVGTTGSIGTSSS